MGSHTPFPIESIYIYIYIFMYIYIYMCVCVCNHAYMDLFLHTYDTKKWENDKKGKKNNSVNGSVVDNFNGVWHML